MLAWTFNFGVPGLQVNGGVSGLPRRVDTTNVALPHLMSGSRSIPPCTTTLAVLHTRTISEAECDVVYVGTGSLAAVTIWH